MSTMDLFSDPADVECPFNMIKLRTRRIKVGDRNRDIVFSYGANEQMIGPSDQRYKKISQVTDQDKIFFFGCATYMVVPHWDHERVYKPAVYTSRVPRQIHPTKCMPDTTLEKRIEPMKRARAAATSPTLICTMNLKTKNISTENYGGIKITDPFDAYEQTTHHSTTFHQHHPDHGRCGRRHLV